MRPGTAGRQAEHAEVGRLGDRPPPCSTRSPGATRSPTEARSTGALRARSARCSRSNWRSAQRNEWDKWVHGGLHERVPHDGLAVRLGSLDRKCHGSGGYLASAFEIDEALVAVRSVAVGDVAGEGVGECVPIEVVGVLDDELADRQEVALDAVEVAGVGRRGDEFDVVGVGVGADVWCPVG
jgi:hypothetical protein